MTNAWDFKLEDYRDVAVFNKHKDLVQSGLVSEENYLKGLRFTSRDNSRTPMQWSNIDNAGFTTGKPWIKINSNYSEINAEQQIDDPNSILNYYKKLIALRKRSDVLVYGSFQENNREHEEIYAYLRQLEDKTVLIIVNFFGNEPTFKFPHHIDYEKAELLLSNYVVEDEASESIKLKPYETRIYDI
jgi:oligo-1,6-glucosidase